MLGQDVEDHIQILSEVLALPMVVDFRCGEYALEQQLSET
jgi:hypothetical protein